MPRRARLTLAGVPHHLIQRGNNRQACFYAIRDYQIYLDWLEQYANICNCEIHAYVLMTNHVHMLVTPKESGGLGIMMRRLGQRYVQYINRTYCRSGTLWEGRFKSCITSEDRYVLSCYRYIELNPVRASLVNHPAEYPWSSYRVNAQGEHSSLIVPQNVYKELDNNPAMRRAAYKELFRDQLELGLMDRIRKATNGNFVLGSGKFSRHVARTLGRRATPAKSGRPKRDEAHRKRY